MKNKWLKWGSIFAVIAPIATIVGCSKKDQDVPNTSNLNNIKKFLESKTQKIITLPFNKRGPIANALNDIKDKIRILLGANKLEGVTWNVALQQGQNDNLDSLNPKNIVITLRKGSEIAIVNGFKVQLAPVDPLALKIILDGKSLSDKMIVFDFDKTQTIDAHKDIIEAQIKRLLNLPDLGDITISIAAAPGESGNIHYSIPKKIIITLKNNKTTKVITGFQVKRLPNQNEQNVLDLEVIQNLKTDLEAKVNSKILKVIIGKIESIDKLKDWIKNTIKKELSSEKLEDVNIKISNIDQSDIPNIDRSNSKLITITFQKGSQTIVLDDFKVQLAKLNLKNIEIILKNIDPKLIQIDIEKVGQLDDFQDEIKGKIKDLLNAQNLNGINIEIVKTPSQNKNGKESITLIFAKDSQEIKITSFFVRLPIVNLLNIKNTLDAKNPKIIELTPNKKGTISDLKNDIESRIEKLIDIKNLNGVEINVEAPTVVTDNVNLNPQSIIIKLKKGTDEKVVSNYKVKLMDTTFESIEEIIIKQTPKLITLTPDKKGTITDLKNDIEHRIKKLIGVEDLKGIEVTVKTPSGVTGNIIQDKSIPIILKLKKNAKEKTWTNFKVQILKVNIESIARILREKKDKIIKVLPTIKALPDTVDYKILTDDIKNQLEDMIGSSMVDSKTVSFLKQAKVEIIIQGLYKDDLQDSSKNFTIEIVINLKDISSTQAIKGFKVQIKKLNLSDLKDILNLLKEKDKKLIFPKDIVSLSSQVIKDKIQGLLPKFLEKYLENILMKFEWKDKDQTKTNITPTFKSFNILISILTDITSEPLKVENFKIKRLKNQDEKYLESLAKDLPKKLATELKNKLVEEAIILLPTATAGKLKDLKAEIQRTIKSLVDDAKTTIEIKDDENSNKSISIWPQSITIILSKGSAKKEVTGLQVMRERTNEESLVFQDKKQFSNFKDKEFAKSIDASANRLVDDKITQLKIKEILGDQASIPAETKGVTREYSIKTDRSGKATVTIKFITKYEENSEIEFTITGFTG